MSYNKHTWATGNVVGAVDLNRIENGIADIDVGYSCTEEWVTLTEESVTTTVSEGSSVADGALTYSEPITADTIKVTFNGTEYIVPVSIDESPGGTEYVYGGSLSEPDPDFSEYPFVVLSLTDSFGSHNILITETAGTYQVEIEVFEEIIETSECFNKAVHSISEPLKVSINNEDFSFDKTWQEIHDAFPNVYVEDQTDGNTNCYAITAVNVYPNNPRPYNIVFASSPSSVYTALTPTSYPAASDR